MNALNNAEYMQTLGVQAKTASAQMARASAAIKSRALLNLAAFLRQDVAHLLAANQRDQTRAAASGLAGSLKDRLKLGAKDLNRGGWLQTTGADHDSNSHADDAHQAGKDGR